MRGGALSAASATSAGCGMRSIISRGGPGLLLGAGPMRSLDSYKLCFKPFGLVHFTPMEPDLCAPPPLQPTLLATSLHGSRSET